ncbi:acetyltransferase-like isoleucine patch superfamily enzyme [Pseudomonas lini]|uniref:acyltransferase n=1 Tax=Pseudomonas lini TaxID=163011 RepID=UPI0027893B52|nr:hypothetical protein [Pseudomonas lini]MDQ0125870.1 acetyltransferase-like isoleucine patch superfamily enzyme [Pseudomonas lini]
MNANRIRLDDRARVGHGNLIIIDALIMCEDSYIGHLNQLTGPFWTILRNNAGIGNQNKSTRARRGVTWGRSMLKVGTWSKITSKHIIDCTRSVVIDDYTTIAGQGSQIWTHGYLHSPHGLDRFRIDGKVRIGSNVYIGSSCVINAGIHVGNAITIGSMSCVSASLKTPGLYVNQPLRLVSLDYQKALNRHPKVKVRGLVEHVVNKRIGSGQ